MLPYVCIWSTTSTYSQYEHVRTFSRAQRKSKIRLQRAERNIDADARRHRWARAGAQTPAASTSSSTAPIFFTPILSKVFFITPTFLFYLLRSRGSAAATGRNHLSNCPFSSCWPSHTSDRQPPWSARDRPARGRSHAAWCAAARGPWCRAVRHNRAAARSCPPAGRRQRAAPHSRCRRRQGA